MLVPSGLPQAQCAVCGVFKGPTNNWFKAVSPKLPTGTSLDGIAFGGSDALVTAADDDLKIEDICGVECLHKRLSRWIDAHQALIAANAPTTTESEKA